MSCAGSVAVSHYMRYLDNGVITWRNVVFLTIKYPPLQTLHPPSPHLLLPLPPLFPLPPLLLPFTQLLSFHCSLHFLFLSFPSHFCTHGVFLHYFCSHFGSVCATLIWRGGLLNVVVWACHVYRRVPLFVLLSLSSETHHRHLTRACTVP